MIRALLAAVLLLAAPVLWAQPINVDEFVGESWYGVYMNNQKAGYAVERVAKNADGEIVVSEDTRFQINMAGIKQDMRIESRRTYSADGHLISIESEIQDPAGTKTFVGTVQGDELILVSVVGNAESRTVMPRPRESLEDAIKLTQLVRSGARVGDAIEFTIFEPLYKKELSGISTIVEESMRDFEGAQTKVYTIKTSMPEMGVDSVSVVAADGTTLEDEVAGLIKMRLEDEKLAKDVDYSNDVIIGNAAMVKSPIKDPRTRKELRLKLHGPIKEGHIFNDDRQKVTPGEGFHLFEGRTYDLTGFTAATLPITDEAVTPWLAATQFVQSDNPRLIAKAQEILAGETDSLKASTKLSKWVHDNMHSTFSARLTNAIEVLDHLEGDCTEHSILFIGLARAAGLPAREVAGVVYVEGSKPGFYFHQWAKVWVGRWIDVDPTFDQPLVDVTHIKLAEGDLFQQARIIPIIGQLEIEEVAE